jgi:hypothetical protein
VSERGELEAHDRQMWCVVAVVQVVQIVAAGCSSPCAHFESSDLDRLDSLQPFVELCLVPEERYPGVGRGATLQPQCHLVQPTFCAQQLQHNLMLRVSK